MILQLPSLDDHLPQTDTFPRQQRRNPLLQLVQASNWKDSKVHLPGLLSTSSRRIGTEIPNVRSNDQHAGTYAVTGMQCHLLLAFEHPKRARFIALE
jgi:hypothetical protein